MDEYENLVAERRNLEKRIYSLEADKRAAENKKLVGKCFKYRNCYSCPEKPSDYFWLYLKVTGVDKTGRPSGWSFEIDKYGDCRVRKERPPSLAGGYKPITSAEFEKAWTKFKAKVNSFAA